MKSSTQHLKQDHTPVPNPLESLSGILSGDLAKTNAIILDKMQSDIDLIPKLAGHLIAAGGKRIRPLLTLATAKLCGYDGGRQHRLAACVEFIHTATLLHDDVVDASDQRRGKASANSVFGNEAAVLVGDFLFSRAFQLMVEDGNIDVLRVLSQASATIAEGEVAQLVNIGNLQISEDSYLRVIESKTAALFAAAGEVGGLVAGASQEQCEALRNYGRYLGTAFQIADDILDYAAAEKNMGKNPGDDFREGKVTLPVLVAYENASPEERDFWIRCIIDRDQTDADLKAAQKLLEKHNAYDVSLEHARSYIQLAQGTLSDFDTENPVYKDLFDLPEFAVYRSH